MHPFYFGSGTRRLFGIYEPSTRAQSRRRAVLLCHPWGPEYLHAHRAMRHLSRLLAESGIDAMRFDYFATGDSGGADGEGDLTGWRSDVATAAEELQSLSGAARVTVVGMRLGASLAVAAAAADLRPTVERLVLWDPVVTGADYFDDLRAMDLAYAAAIGDHDRRPAIDGTQCEIVGFPLTARIQHELAQFSLASVAGAIACPVFVVASTTRAACERMRSALSPVKALEIQRIENPPVWIEDWPQQSGLVPVKTLRQIVEWVAT